MARCRLFALLSALVLFAAACGTDTVVVSGASLEPVEESAGPTPAPVEEAAPAEAAAEDATPEIEVQLPDDLGSVLGGDDGVDRATDASTAEAEDEVDEPPAVLGMLQQAAVATASSDSYRYEVGFEMYIDDGTTVFDVAPDLPLTSGAVAGDRSWVMTDLGPVFDAVFDAAGPGSAQALLGDDLSMQVIVEGSDRMYLRAPLFAALADIGALPVPELAALGDGWAVIDLSAATGLTAAELDSLVGVQTGVSADQLLEMIGAIGGDVTEAGPSEVRGVSTVLFRAEVAVVDVLSAQDVAAEDIAALGDAALDDLTIPFDIHVDADGRIRRMEVVIDTAAISDLIGGAPGGAEARISTVVDLYDFGADIDIVDPATLGAVDLTDAFSGLVGA